jgi:uncharacterized repeat protein (TIGR03803 family)
MNRRKSPRVAIRLLGLFMVILALGVTASAEWKERVLYSFQGGSDGATPVGSVALDKAGNLYGATSDGGSTCLPQGCGTVFRVSPPSRKVGAWTGETIYTFRGAFNGLSDGLTPGGGLVADQHGDLFGTTTLGGNGGCVLLGTTVGCGIVYELSPPKQKGGEWTETILYNFHGGSDGYFPRGDLVFDSHGNLYGATWFGGGKGTTCNQFYGGNCGTVFELSPPTKKGGAWKEKILRHFGGATDGANPNGDLVFDGTGAIYGTAVSGGYGNGICDPGGCGIAFELIPPIKNGGPWTEKMIYRFHGKDGASPVSVIFGTTGDLYGSATGGGNSGSGAVFALTPPAGGGTPWIETLLYRFRGNNDGTNPKAGLVFDADGNLYGTTAVATNRFAQGNVFRLKPSSQTAGIWSFSVLHTFAGSPDGASPSANLILIGSDVIFSTTQLGGTGTACQGGCGSVFEISPLIGVTVTRQELGSQ